MKRQRTAIAKKLFVTHIEDHGLDGDGLSQAEERNYVAYEFENGLVMVPGESDRDWYFPSCEALAMAEGGTTTIEGDGEASFDVGAILVDLWGSMEYYKNYDCKELCSINAWLA
jgi:hypothetical protein